MKIGVNLGGTVYSRPVVFRELLDALNAAGHVIFCVAPHARETFEQVERARLAGYDIDPNMFDTSLMPKTEPASDAGKIAQKIRMANACDIVFDDAADKYQHLTTSLVFRVPPPRG